MSKLAPLFTAIWAVAGMRAPAAHAEPCHIRLTMPGYSEIQEADTRECVADVVKRLGVVLGPLDRVYPRPWGEVFEGLEIQVIRVRMEEAVRDAKIPFPVVLADDPSLAPRQVVLAEQDWCDGFARGLVRIYQRSDGITEWVPGGSAQVTPPRPKIFRIGPSDQLPERLRTEIVMQATAYSGEEPGMNSRTALGLPVGRGIVAVDPRVIPLGTKMWVEGYGWGVAADTGGAITGNRIDLCFDTLEEALQYGIRDVRVRFIP